MFKPGDKVRHQSKYHDGGRMIYTVVSANGDYLWAIGPREVYHTLYAKQLELANAPEYRNGPFRWEFTRSDGGYPLARVFPACDSTSVCGWPILPITQQLIDHLQQQYDLCHTSSST